MRRGQSKRFGRWEIKRCDQPRSRPGAPTLGPMGGGWRWKLGILGGRRDWIIELVYLQFRITLHPRRDGVSVRHAWVDETRSWKSE